jgi:hypothetical protein
MKHSASFVVDVYNVAGFMVLGADKWRCGGELMCSELMYCKICRFAAMLLSSNQKQNQSCSAEMGPQYGSNKQLCCGLYIGVVSSLRKGYLCTLILHVLQSLFSELFETISMCNLWNNDFELFRSAIKCKSRSFWGILARDENCH